MRRIVEGRLYDTENCLEVGWTARKGRDPVTGAELDYREVLYREVQLKPGESVDSAYKKGSYSYKWDETKVDTRRGAFILVVRRGWNDDEALFMLVEEKDARRWLEEHRPSDVETYEKFFGPCRNQFSADPQSGLATETILKLDSKIKSQKWDLDAEGLQKKLDAMETGL